MIISEFLEFVRSFSKLWAIDPLAVFSLVVLSVAGAVFLTWQYLKRRDFDPTETTSYQRLAAQKDDLDGTLTNLNNLRAALDGEEDELWRLQSASIPDDVRVHLKEGNPRVVTVMNLKGGVGKTTTVANLAAHFGAQGKRVLAIDLDYQGSLTRMMLLGAGHRLDREADPRAASFIAADADPAALFPQVISLQPKMPKVDLVTCGATFDKFEGRLFIRHLIGDEPVDARIRLAKLLTSEPFRSTYDLVLIDAPPRMSTGAINALVASQIVLIPSVLDGLSTDAIRLLVDRFNAIRKFCPALDRAGVIGTLSGQVGGLDVKEASLQKASENLANWTGTAQVFENDIKYLLPLARAAGTNVGYLTDKNVKIAYELLGEELQRELNL